MGMRPRALLVDDSFTVRLDLRAALSTAGFAVTACGTLEEALRVLKLSFYHLAILDVILPDGSGLDLLKEIKQTPELQSTRVFMLSSEDAVNQRINGLRLGADLYIGKPYDRGYVARAARELFQMSDTAEQPTSRRALSNKNILLVDDSPTFLNALAWALREDGHQVVMAYSGEDALALVEVERFDCVLVDLVMPAPGLDGLQTCQRMRAMSRTEQVPIALMTATPPAGIQEAASAVGANEVLVKSADLFRMCEAVRDLLLQKHRQRNADSVPAAASSRHHEQAFGSEVPMLYQELAARTGLSAPAGKSTPRVLRIPPQTPE